MSEKPLVLTEAIRSRLLELSGIPTNEGIDGHFLSTEQMKIGEMVGEMIRLMKMDNWDQAGALCKKIQQNIDAIKQDQHLQSILSKNVYHQQPRQLSPEEVAEREQIASEPTRNIRFR